MSAQCHDSSSYARLLCAYTNKKNKICPRMPVYCVLFRSKFSTVSGYMINCWLTEFGWAGRENIWLSVIKQGPRCAPTTQSISTQYFGFVRHTFITHCNWTCKMKSFILFLMGNVKLKCWVFEKFDLHHKIDHSTT